MEREFVEQALIERFKTFDSWPEPNGLLCERMLRYAMDNSCEVLARHVWDKFTDAEVDEMIEEATMKRSRLHRVHPQDSRMINHKEFVQLMVDQSCADDSSSVAGTSDRSRGGHQRSNWQ